MYYTIVCFVNNFKLQRINIISGDAISLCSRTTINRREYLKSAGRKTAIMELKLLALIRGEAFRCGYEDVNPLPSMKLKKDKTDIKTEMTDGAVKTIGRSLKDEPGWMQTRSEN